MIPTNSINDIWITFFPEKLAETMKSKFSLEFEADLYEAADTDFIDGISMVIHQSLWSDPSL